MSLSGKLNFSSAGEDETFCPSQKAAHNPVNATDAVCNAVCNTKRKAKFVLTQMEERGSAGIKRVNAYCFHQPKTPYVLPKRGVAEEKAWWASNVNPFTTTNVEIDGTTLLKSGYNGAKPSPKAIGSSAGYTATLKNMLHVTVGRKPKVEQKKAVEEEWNFEMMEMEQVDEEEEYEEVDMNKTEKDEAEMAEWEEI